MHRFIGVVALPAVLTFVPLRAADDPAKADKAMLQGMWELTNQVAKFTLEVKGDTFTFRRDGKVTRHVTATFHATKKPKALDLKEDGEDKPFLAIYQLDKERLTLCIAVEKARPTNTRPTAFEAKPGQVLTTYTKAKR